MSSYFYFFFNHARFALDFSVFLFFISSRLNFLLKACETSFFWLSRMHFFYVVDFSHSRDLNKASWISLAFLRLAASTLEHKLNRFNVERNFSPLHSIVVVAFHRWLRIKPRSEGDTSEILVRKVDCMCMYVNIWACWFANHPILTIRKASRAHLKRSSHWSAISLSIASQSKC